ncbi:hypothetical protein [Helicobacter burdigaliensis]|uniref:hypothetical protein n=1 Tax=Helicobacter burdigaliensis TaxID=2315334 RepID=UPI000EF71A28|nr:hypothetical protein [Helicobacter burdigaliensis]
MKKKIIKGGRKRIFDTKNTKKVKTKIIQDDKISIVAINYIGIGGMLNSKIRNDNKIPLIQRVQGYNNIRINSLAKYEKEIYHFLTEDTKENLMEISSNGEVKFSYQENLLLKEI